MNRTALLLAEGQYLDIELQGGGTPATPEAYEQMITRKTGVLFACACRLGALAGGASAEAEEAYAAYGLELGLAFQEQDDMLGVWGLSAETGKPDAADIVERKRGLPAALALSRPDTPSWLVAAYAERNGGMAQPLVERVIGYFDEIELRREVEQRVERRYHRALECLEAANPREPAKTYLASAVRGAGGPSRLKRPRRRHASVGVPGGSSAREPANTRLLRAVRGAGDAGRLSTRARERRKHEDAGGACPRVQSKGSG